MHPDDVVVAQEQRYERLARDAEQWRLAKLVRTSNYTNWARGAWARLRSLVARRGRARKEEPRPVQLNLDPASES